MEINNNTNSIQNDTTQNLKDALCEVRKAHRLIYSYQKRILSLIRFIRTRLGFSEVTSGYKHFSNPIVRYQHSMFNLKVFEDMWTWDFIYPYIFEYYCNEKENKDNSTIILSIVQYSDTGYFENYHDDNEDEPDPADFSPVEKSGTKLMFIMERKPSRCHVYLDENTTGEIIMTPQYASMTSKKEILYPKGEGKNAILLYSVPLERFVNEESTLKVLKEYLVFLQQNDIELELC